MEIDISHPFRIFDDHLSKPNNERILFSAPFGYGKTYFLGKFFEENESYESFFLSPVKYVVGQNEDIFEYIKIDIGLLLINHPSIMSEEISKFSNDLYLDQYLKSKPLEVCKLY